MRTIRMMTKNSSCGSCCSSSSGNINSSSRRRSSRQASWASENGFSILARGKLFPQPESCCAAYAWNTRASSPCNGLTLLMQICTLRLDACVKFAHWRHCIHCKSTQLKFPPKVATGRPLALSSCRNTWHHDHPRMALLDQREGSLFPRLNVVE